MKRINGQPGSYPVHEVIGEHRGEYRKISSVFAAQLTEDAEIETPEGVMSAKAGDYLAQHEDGHAWVIKRETFESTYERV